MTHAKVSVNVAHPIFEGSHVPISIAALLKSTAAMMTGCSA